MVRWAFILNIILWKLEQNNIALLKTFIERWVLIQGGFQKHLTDFGFTVLPHYNKFLITFENEKQEDHHHQINYSNTNTDIWKWKPGRRPSARRLWSGKLGEKYMILMILGIWEEMCDWTKPLNQSIQFLFQINLNIQVRSLPHMPGVLDSYKEEAARVSDPVIRMLHITSK